MFNIEGKNSAQAKPAIEEQLEQLTSDFNAGDKKAGRYIGLYYLLKAAERDDITSQIAIGHLLEFGVILDRNTDEAKAWYKKAIAQDHPKKDGTMLAAAATAAMKRLGS